MNAEDVVSTIEAMRNQEEQCYCASDYLVLPSDQARGKRRLGGDKRVNDDCRYRMAQWCYQVVDFCKFNRDTVAIAMNYLDRYMSTEQGAEALKSRSVFQLTAMTCLYTAIKTHEPEAMEPKVISGLSRNVYSPQQVEDMERKVITALQWRMNPPTALPFIHAFMTFLPEEALDESQRKATIELAIYQTELAVEDYAYVGIKASTIAFAALTNALQTMDSMVRYDFLKKVSSVSKIDTASQLFVLVQEELWSSIDTTKHKQQRNQLVPQSQTIAKTTGSSLAIHGSPRGVISS